MRQNDKAQADFSNEQAVTIAVAHLGGDTRSVDTEDVADVVVKIAPGRFMWRKYPDRINIELVHTALRDAKRISGLVTGSGTDGWRLSDKGLAFVRDAVQRGLTTAPPRKRLNPQERVWAARERARLVNEPAFLKYLAGDTAEISEGELNQFFRLDEYVRGSARSDRVQRIVGFFGDDPELGNAVLELAKRMTVA